MVFIRKFVRILIDSHFLIHLPLLERLRMNSRLCTFPPFGIRTYAKLPFEAVLVDSE